MYHNFFIHSSVDGHPGCFHVLAIVNSAAMNSGIRVSFLTLVSSGYMPTSGNAGHTVVLFLVFKGISYTTRACIPTYSVSWQSHCGEQYESSNKSVSCSVVSSSLQPHGLSPVHGILQARILELAIPFSRGSSQPRDQSHVSCMAGEFFTV